jgi:ADP-heptose:LPS heptosyltransferase
LPNLSSKPIDLAFFRTSSLGDIILSSHVLRSLENAAGIQAESNQEEDIQRIFWFGSSQAEPILQKHFPKVHFHSEQSPDAVRAILAKQNFNGAFIDLQRNPRSAKVSFAVGSMTGVSTFKIEKRRLARRGAVLRSRLFGRGRTHEIGRCSAHQLDLVLQVTNAALKSMGLSSIQKNLPSSDAPKHKRICLAPQAGYLAKSMPLEFFEKLVVSLDRSSAGGIEFTLIGCLPSSPYEKVIGELKRACSVVSTSNPLSNTAEALAGAALTISADSAPLHLSEFAGTPCAAVFGPTVTNFGFAPLLPESKVFESSVGCRPCSLHGKSGCRYNDFACFDTNNIPIIVEFAAERLGLC